MKRMIDAAILAGGRAERMGGRPKALLTVGGKRIVDRQVEALRPLVREILLVVGDPSPYAGVEGVRVVVDRHPGRGPLAGLHAAMFGSDAEALLVVGCDLPLLDRGLLERVRDHAPEAEAVMPIVGKRPQALHARYARSIRDVVARRLRAGELKLLALLDELKTEFLDEEALRAAARHRDLRGLTNVNTPDDLDRAESLA